MPVISTIIPIYNSERYLSRCLDSLLCQNFEDFEIIAVDDGSTDKSALILDAYKVKDNRIRVIHTANKGVSAARNLGLREAAGEYINYVDSDDYVEPDYYLKLIEGATKNGADIAQCSYDYIYDSGKVKTDDEGFEGTIIGTESILRHHYDGMIGTITMASWNKLIRRDVIGDITFDETLTTYEDVDFMYKLLTRCDKVTVIRDKLYHYRQHEDSAMHKAWSRSKLQCFDVYERILADIKDDDSRLLLTIRETIQALWIMREALANNDKESLKLLRSYAIKNIKDLKRCDKTPRALVSKLYFLKFAPLIYYSILRARI